MKDEETSYGLELLGANGLMPEHRLADQVNEANGLAAILITCVKHAKNS